MNIVEKILNSSKENSTAHLKNEVANFSGSPVVEISPSDAGGAGFGQGANIPHAWGPKKKNKTKHKTEAIL